MLRNQQKRNPSKKNKSSRQTLLTAPSNPNFNRRRPKFLQPGSHLNPSLQNMFDLGYFTGPPETVPTGWSEVDEDRVYPTLASRNPQLRRNEDTESSNEFDRTSIRAGSEISNDDDEHPSNTMSSVTRMNEESSEEDEDPIRTRVSVPIFVTLLILLVFSFSLGSMMKVVLTQD
jgi:ubiquitin carboxyl-terminal hydrolase 4/11/15